MSESNTNQLGKILDDLKRLTPNNANPDTKYEKTLMKAIEENNIDVCNLMLDTGMVKNLNYLDSNNNTALILAIRLGRTEIFKNLVDKGADINVTTSRNYTPLIIAACHGKIEIVKILVDKGSNLDFVDNDGDTALMTATYHGQIEIVKILVDKGANLDFVDRNKDSALISAVRMNRTEIVKFLVDKGANIDLINKNGNTALLLATQINNSEIIKILTDTKTDKKSDQKYLCIDSDGKEYPIFDKDATIKIGCRVPEGTTTLETVSGVIDSSTISVKYRSVDQWKSMDMNLNGSEIQLSKDNTAKAEYHIVPVGLVAEEMYVKFPADMKILINGKCEILGNIYRK